MREIKFRLWDKYFKFMDYDFSNNYLITNDGKVLEKVEKRFADQYWYEYEEDENCVIMQYTGIKDKNSKDIYEGDILQDDAIIGEVKWLQEHCAFVVFSRGESSQYHFLESDGQLKYSEVIGNVFEMPDREF